MHNKVGEDIVAGAGDEIHPMRLMITIGQPNMRVIKVTIMGATTKRRGRWLEGITAMMMVG